MGKYGPAMYAKGHSVVLQMRRQYDEILEKYDVIMLPTLKNIACPIPDESNFMGERLCDQSSQKIYCCLLYAM